MVQKSHGSGSLLPQTPGLLLRTQGLCTCWPTLLDPLPMHLDSMPVITFTCWPQLAVSPRTAGAVSCSLDHPNLNNCAHCIIINIRSLMPQTRVKEYPSFKRCSSIAEKTLFLFHLRRQIQVPENENTQTVRLGVAMVHPQ